MIIEFDSLSDGKETQVCLSNSAGYITALSATGTILKRIYYVATNKDALACIMSCYTYMYIHMHACTHVHTHSSH